MSTPEKNQTIVVSNNGPAKTIVGGLLLAGGLYYLKQKWDSYQVAKENKKAGEDPNVNIASQIHSENRATYTENDVQIGLFRQITDYKKTSDAYKIISSGKDILEDTKPHVSSGTYQQILNIIGIKGGATKATSQASTEVQTNLKAFTWVVSKVDARIRKSPKAGSAVFTMRPNVIATAKGNSIIGIIDKATLLKNGGKLFYDDANNTFFLPILVFDKDDPRKYYPAYVAISNVNVFKDQPKQLTFFRISAMSYQQAYAVSGIEKTNLLDGLTDVSKLLL